MPSEIGENEGEARSPVGASGGVVPGQVAPESLAWEKQQGLLPAIVQDAASLRVLMVGYMDLPALQATLDTGLVTFHSRSRNEQWVKGETSGNTLQLVRVEADCDADSLLVIARPAGPTCHTGQQSCFETAPGAFLAELDEVISRRKLERPEDSYTAALLQSGVRRVAQKVGEEGVETALAAVAQSDDELLGEAADLLYHLIVLLQARELSLEDAVAVLERRHRP